MGLKKITYHSLDYIPCALVAYIEELLENHGVLSVVVPSNIHVNHVQKTLANSKGATSGVAVYTFAQYIESLWHVITDGRQIAQKPQIEVMAANMLGDSPRDLNKAHAVAEVVIEASCELRKEFASSKNQNCAEILIHAKKLLDLLTQAGCVTQKDAMEAIAASATSFHPVVFSGFEQGDASFISFVKHISEHTEATYVVPRTTAGMTLADKLPENMQEYASQEDLGGAELEALREAVFTESATVLDPPTVSAEPQLIFLDPLGPSAEAEAVARLIEQCENAEQILVVTTNPERMWRRLAPKLASVMTVHASWAKRLSSVKPVALFLNFVEQMWAVLEDQKQWEAFAHKWRGISDATFVSSEERKAIAKDYASLPESWWPPKAIVDFLHSSCSPFGAYGAKDIDNFDVFIRSRRDITPTKLLESLNRIADQNSKKAQTSQLLFNVIKKHVLEYDLQGAIEAVLQVVIEDSSQVSKQAMQKLYALLQTITLEDEEVVSNTCAAAHRKLRLLRVLAASTSFQYSFQANDLKGYQKTSVDIVSYSEAVQLRPRSYSLCVLLDQSMEAQATRSYPTSVERLVADVFNNKKLVSHELEVQANNFRLLALGREQVAFEKPQFSETGREVFPSPLLSAVESHYTCDDLREYKVELQKRLGSFVQQSEEHIWQNYASRKAHSESKAYERQSDVILSGKAQEIVGHAIKKDEKTGKHRLSKGIRLSPTSLDDLNACPRKWFFERGLPTQSQDAKLEATTKGTLYHEVLRRAMSDERMSETAVEDIWNMNFAKAFARAAGVDVQLSKEERKELQPFFDALPKRFQEVQDIDDIQSNIERLVKSGAILVEGFEPRLYEYEFDSDTAKYAGVGQKGSIDRIDVDAHGNVLIIDYKSSKKKTLQKYAVDPEKKEIRYPQTFIYARIVENLATQIKKDLGFSEKDPDIKVAGVLYLGVADDQAYFGYVSKEKFPYGIKTNCYERSNVLLADLHSLVDNVENRMTSLIQQELVQGLLLARPLENDKKVCDYCKFKYKCSFDMKRKQAAVEKRELWSGV